MKFYDIKPSYAGQKLQSTKVSDGSATIATFSLFRIVMLLKADFQRNLRVLQIFHNLKLNPLRVVKGNGGILVGSPVGFGRFIPWLVLVWGMLHGLYVAVRTVEYVGTRNSVDESEFVMCLDLFGGSMVSLWWYWVYFLRYPEITCAVFNTLCASLGKLCPPIAHVGHGIVSFQCETKCKPDYAVFQSQAAKKAAPDGAHIQGKIGLRQL